VRRCFCDRVSSPGGEYRTGDCVRCWLWHDPGEKGKVYRCGVDKDCPKSHAKVVNRAVPCEYFGNRLLSLDVVNRGLSPSRTWFNCEAGHGVVCPCGAFGGDPHGCKGCPDYSPESS
jgi:hypothetical protein